MTGRDALEFLLLGARAVQVGTANFLRPDQGARIVEEIVRFLEDRGIDAIDDWIGSVKDWD